MEHISQCTREGAPDLTCMRAVQTTSFGGPEVLDIVDVPEPTPGRGQKLYDVSTAGVNFADTHHCLS
jgi:NADPH:quinone reductase-like Zn-dependent oxidoreductase